MANKVLLLDFDGVVLRRHPCFHEVKSRCVAYVRKTTRCADPKLFNQYLYKTYGHTVIGLQKDGHKTAEVSEFNDYVYRTFPYETYFADIKETHADHIEDVSNVLQDAKNDDIDTYLFTNAPHIWCHSVLYFMDLPRLPILPMEGLLKPQPDVYKLVSSYFPQSKITFVDDSPINFQPILNDKQWNNVLMHDGDFNLQDVLDPM